jgi:toluene monooxygenase electron transfer component
MPEVRLEGTEVSFSCAPGDTILRAGLRAGLPLPYECNVGGCGTCKMDLVAGEVTSQWSAAPGLTERDIARGRVLACQSMPQSDCTVKARLREEYRPKIVPGRFTATLVATIDLTHDLREFRLRAEGPARFLPGQYALLGLRGVPGHRAYSMSNVPNDDGEWHFQIKRVGAGAATSALFDATPLGSTLTLDGPYGNAYLRPDAPRDVICIAGGSGLSPNVAIARAFVDAPQLASRKLHFFYGGRAPRDVCGEGLLRRLSGFGERLFYYPSVSGTDGDGAQRWTGHVGFVHELVDLTLGERLADHELYFAGPPAMAKAVQLMLFHRKVPQAQQYFDRFF